MEVSESAKAIIKQGSVKIRVVRSGMYQSMTFTVKKIAMGNIIYSELFIARQIDISELQRIAQETGLPIEAQNGKAFPKGASASDFQNL